MLRLLRFAPLMLVPILLTFHLMKWVEDLGFYSNYDPDLAFNAQAESIDTVNDTKEVFGIEVDRQFRKYVVRFESRPDEIVPALVTLPLEQEGPYPTVIFLHGSGQDKDFLTEVCSPFNKAGFALVSFDQFGRGERKVEGGLLEAGLTYRDRTWKTVNDSRRLIDYLSTKPERFDTERLYLVGASYGAITGSNVVAFDNRIKGAALVVGGGDIPVMMDAPMIKENLPGPVHGIAKAFAAYFMEVSDPVNYAHLSSPTPVLMQNGSEDKLVWPEAGKALYAALGEPKEIKWYPIDHPGLRKKDGPIVLDLLNDTLAWLQERDEAVVMARDGKNEETASLATQ